MTSCGLQLTFSFDGRPLTLRPPASWRHHGPGGCGGSTCICILRTEGSVDRGGFDGWLSCQSQTHKIRTRGSGAPSSKTLQGTSAPHQLLAVLLAAWSSAGQLLHFQLPDSCSTDFIVSLDSRDAANIDCDPSVGTSFPRHQRLIVTMGVFYQIMPLLCYPRHGRAAFLPFSLPSHLVRRGVHPVRHRPFTITFVFSHPVSVHLTPAFCWLFIAILFSSAVSGKPFAAPLTCPNSAPFS